MKNRIVLLLGAAALFSFASCSNSGEQGSYTQEQLDSIANYRADSIAKVMKIKNDSIIAARAVDSALKAEAKKHNKSAQSEHHSEPAKSPKSSQVSNATLSSTSNNSSMATETTEKVEKHHVRTQAEIEADKKAARFGDKAAQARLKKDEALNKAARMGDKNAQKILKERENASKAARFQN